MDELLNNILLTQAIHCKKNNIELPETLKKVYDGSTTEDKCETEINLIEAEYKLKEEKLK